MALDVNVIPVGRLKKEMTGKGIPAWHVVLTILTTVASDFLMQETENVEELLTMPGFMMPISVMTIW